MELAIAKIHCGTMPVVDAKWLYRINLVRASTPGSEPWGAERREIPKYAFQEQHYSIKELAKLWGFSGRSILLFAYEPGVSVIEKAARCGRRYRRVQIPASVAERVHRRLDRYV